MNEFVRFIKHDFTLLQRNNIIALSAIVSLLYIGVFQLLSGMEQLDKVLILIIYNDPALLGILFVGVMVLFEKNENTLQALSVTPFKAQNYVLSKSFSMALVALACSLPMVFAGHGFTLNYWVFSLAVILSTMTFAFMGFWIVSYQDTFNKYMLVSVVVLVALMAPFLGLFDILPNVFFWIFPTHATIEMMHSSLQENQSSGVFLYLGIAIFWCVLFYLIAVRTIKKRMLS